MTFQRICRFDSSVRIDPTLGDECELLVRLAAGDYVRQKLHFGEKGGGWREGNIRGSMHRKSAERARSSKDMMAKVPRGVS